MLRFHAFVAIFGLFGVALGCGRTTGGLLDLRLPDGALAHPDGGVPNVGAHASGAGAGAARHDAGMPNGVGAAPAHSGGPAGVASLGTGGFGRIGTGGNGAAGSGVGVVGTGGVGVRGTGGFFMVGGAGAAVFGTGGTGSMPACVYSASSGTCMYPGGGSCNQFGYCCAISNNRCCDGTGRCSDPLPAPPAWVPPVAASDLGTPGWKQSKDPLCLSDGNYTYGISVWSDSRGVFVAAAGAVQYNNPNQYDPECPGCPKEKTMFNDGTGWSQVAGSSFYGMQKMKGFDAGPLAFYGYTQTTMSAPGVCGLSILKAGTRTCEPVDGVTDVATVRSDLAYAALQGDLVRYDGSHWGPVTAVLPGQHELNMLWADANVVMATGMSPGKIYTLRSDAWKLEDTRTLETFTTIWALAANDVWAGTQQESLYHYDGNAWNKVSWPGSNCSQQSGITSMWGASGTLYFSTSTTLARWNGSKVDLLAQWPCDSSQGAPNIAGLWGNSPTELFIAITDATDQRQPCGMQYLLYYDGSKFHRM